MFNNPWTQTWDFVGCLFTRILSEQMPHNKMHQHRNKSKRTKSCTSSCAESPLIMKPLSIPKFHAGFSPPTKRSNLDAENVKWPSLHTTSQSPHLFRKLSQFGKGSDLLPKSTLVKIITKKQMFHAARRSSSWVQFKLQESLKFWCWWRKDPDILYTLRQIMNSTAFKWICSFCCLPWINSAAIRRSPIQRSNAKCLGSCIESRRTGFLSHWVGPRDQRITKKMLMEIKPWTNITSVRSSCWKACCAISLIYNI